MFLGSPDILSNCHRGNDLLHSLLLLLFLITVKLCFELKDLPCRHKRKRESHITQSICDEAGGKLESAASGPMTNFPNLVK